MPLPPLHDPSPGPTRRQASALLAALAMAGAAPRARAQAGEPFTPTDLAHAHGLREQGLQDTQAYALAESLVTEVGARAAGSPNDARAVQWALARLRQLGLANVRAEPVPLRAWQRGPAQARLTAPYPHPLVMTALGNSVGTSPQGLEAEVAYYADLQALKADDSERPRGRLVFIDQKTERTRDGSGYGRAVAARSAGAVEAARRAPWRWPSAPSAPTMTASPIPAPCATSPRWRRSRPLPSRCPMPT